MIDIANVGGICRSPLVSQMASGLSDTSRQEKRTSESPRTPGEAIPRPGADRARKLAAKRQKRRRQLLKAGNERFTVVTNGDALAPYLIAMHRMTEDQARSHYAIEGALRLLVNDLVERERSAR